MNKLLGIVVKVLLNFCNLLYTNEFRDTIEIRSKYSGTVKNLRMNFQILGKLCHYFPLSYVINRCIVTKMFIKSPYNSCYTNLEDFSFT